MRDLLHSKIDIDAGLRTLALPNMSFNEITPARLRECFTPDTIQLADVIGVIRSRKFAENLASDGFFSPLGSLFSPFTSSRALDRLVSEHPKLAPLAAIHPNGLHISGNLIPDSNIASLVAKNRGANVLAGRSPGGAVVANNALVVE